MSPRATARLDPDELAGLEEQRDFLLRSLADLEREHDAGDLTDEDFAELRDDYTARAADVLRAIDEQRSAFDDAKAPRNWARTLVVGGAVAAFALVAGLLAANAMGARKPGESASGGISVQASASQRANECSQDLTTDPVGSLDCLEKILEEDPTNAVALTWSAWQYSLVADQVEGADRVRLQALAAVRLEEAVASDPNYSYARAFRTVVAMRNGRYEDAQRFLEEFEANDPSAQAAQLIEQFEVEERIEAGLAGEGAAGGDGAGPAVTTTTQPG